MYIYIFLGREAAARGAELGKEKKKREKATQGCRERKKKKERLPLTSLHSDVPTHTLTRICLLARGHSSRQFLWPSRRGMRGRVDQSIQVSLANPVFKKKKSDHTLKQLNTTAKKKRKFFFFSDEEASFSETCFPNAPERNNFGLLS